MNPKKQSSDNLFFMDDQEGGIPTLKADKKKSSVFAVPSREELLKMEKDYFASINIQVFIYLKMNKKSWKPEEPK